MIEPAPTTTPKNAPGLASAIVGAVALLLAVIPGLSLIAWLPAVAAIVLGVIGLTRKNRPRRLAWTGVGLGAAGWLVAIAVSISSVLFLAALDPGPASSSATAAPSAASPAATATATAMQTPTPTPTPTGPDWTAALGGMAGFVSASETEPGRVEVQTSLVDPRGSDGSPAAREAIGICEAAVSLGATYVSVLESDGTTFVLYGHPAYGKVCTEV